LPAEDKRASDIIFLRKKPAARAMMATIIATKAVVIIVTPIFSLSRVRHLVLKIPQSRHLHVTTSLKNAKSRASARLNSFFVRRNPLARIPERPTPGFLFQ
ncbi:MAG: hypothetical protein AABZ63_00475, partial [Actinomycetota bacterium]